MAQNPMQRKMTNAFLLGMFVTLLIAAIVVMVLIKQLKTEKDAKAKIEAENNTLYKTAYIATTKIPEGQIVFGTDEAMSSGSVIFQRVAVATELSQEELLSDADLSNVEPVSGIATPKILAAAIEIPAGAVLTKSMVKDTNVDSSERLMEYNMISLPSQMLENTYVDIRLLLPSGDDFVVVSKKFVTQVNATTIWMKMRESEIESLSNAIIDSYIVAGSKLYASIYSSPTSQVASKVTYVPSQNVREIIQVMLNVDEAHRTEFASLSEVWKNLAGVRGRIQAYYGEAEEQKEAATAGIETEKTNLQSARDAYLESMGY